MSKTYEQINERIRSGKAVVYTAEEVIDLVKEKGAELIIATCHWGTEKEYYPDSDETA